MSGVSSLIMALDRVEFAKALGLEPDPWQEHLLRTPSDRILLNCSRQSGKSTMAAVIALHRALYHPKSLILMLAPSQRQAQESFAKITDFYGTLGFDKDSLPSDRKLGTQFPNKSRIEALPGLEKTIRGYSGVSLLVLDEASRISDSLYYAVRPMLAVSGGSVLALSTPNGKEGFFYQTWEDGGHRWTRFEVPARSCPRISAEFLEEEREALRPEIFRQEYECSFEEHEDQVFSEADIQRIFSGSFGPAFPELGEE